MLSDCNESYRFKNTCCRIKIALDKEVHKMGLAKYTEDNIKLYEDRIAMQEHRYHSLNRYVCEAYPLNSTVCIVVENGSVQVFDINEYLNCLCH